MGQPNSADPARDSTEEGIMGYPVIVDLELVEHLSQALTEAATAFRLFVEKLQREASPRSWRPPQSDGQSPGDPTERHQYSR